MIAILLMTFSNSFSSIKELESPKFVAKGPIDSKSALVQLMAWLWTGNQSLTEPVVAKI